MAADTAQARFDHFEIYFCETAVDELTGYFAENYGGATPALVYDRASQDVIATAGVYWGVDFDTPFVYTGRGNLLVELRWAGDDEGFIYTYVCAEPVYTFVSAHYSNATFGGTKLMQHRFRLTVDAVGIEPTSFGRVRAVYR